MFIDDTAFVEGDDETAVISTWLQDLVRGRGMVIVNVIKLTVMNKVKVWI